MTVWNKLEHDIKMHDWDEKYRPHTLMDRIEIMRRIRQLSVSDLGELLKAVRQDAAVQISALLAAPTSIRK